ncbi:MAG: hypothetical protein N2Z21_09970, partial [Candidatus Sumerlaeaceae bacterium]|nr:hypothetical protein [Candidatus Sumerlaeaceae bacterium]
MSRTIIFIAHQNIAKEQRERFLRALRDTGLAPKPLVADPLTRCGVLLDFVKRMEKSGDSVFVCLDTPELILTRVVAGHAQASVAAVMPQFDESPGAIRGWCSNLETPFVVVFPSTPQGLVEWLRRTFAEFAAITQEPMADSVGSIKVVGARIGARAKFSPEDAEWLEKVEKEFRPRLRASTRAADATPKSKSLDFSIELRRIISNARE